MIVREQNVRTVKPFSSWEVAFNGDTVHRVKRVDGGKEKSEDARYDVWLVQESGVELKALTNATRAQMVAQINMDRPEALRAWEAAK